MMKKRKLGIIGGSGLYKMDGFDKIKWKKIKTDRLGLNNDKFIDKFDILLMGDSFAEGSCVNQSDEPAYLLNQNYNLKTYKHLSCFT